MRKAKKISETRTLSANKIAIDQSIDFEKNSNKSIRENNNVSVPP